MKKIIVLFVLIFAAEVNAQQAGGSEVHLGFSDAFYVDFANTWSGIFGDAIISGISGAKIKDADVNRLGMFEAGYRYNLSKRIKVGGDLNYFKMDRTFKINNSHNKRSTTYILVMPNLEFSYLKSSRLNFYGSVSAGYANVSTKEKAPLAAHYSNNDGTFAYQINPLGLNWTLIDDKLGVFAELGFGYKGIGLIGVSYKL